MLSNSDHDQVLVSYGYEWVEAPEWYKQAWSKSKYRVRQCGGLQLVNINNMTFL